MEALSIIWLACISVFGDGGLLGAMVRKEGGGRYTFITVLNCLKLKPCGQLGACINSVSNCLFLSRGQLLSKDVGYV